MKICTVVLIASIVRTVSRIVTIEFTLMIRIAFVLRLE